MSEREEQMRRATNLAKQPLEARQMILGVEDDHRKPTIIEPGALTKIFCMPQQFFRPDFLFLDCDGLILTEARVGCQLQEIHTTPASFFNQNRNYEELEELALAYLRAKPADIDKTRLALLDRVSSSKYEGTKGQAVKFDTAEVGNTISLYFRNPTDKPIMVSGCYTGRTIP